MRGGDGEGFEGFAGADAFDGGKEVEEVFVFGAKEAQHFWGERAEGGIAFDVFDGEEGDGLADFGLEEGDVGSGDEEFVGEVRAGHVDAVIADEFEFSGESYDHKAASFCSG